MGSPSVDVRFTPKSRHRLARWRCPLCAKSGLMHRSKKARSFDHLVGARHGEAKRDLSVCSNLLAALASGARDDLAEQLPGHAVKFLKLHLLNRSEIVRASVDSDTGQ